MNDIIESIKAFDTDKEKGISAQELESKISLLEHKDISTLQVLKNNFEADTVVSQLKNILTPALYEMKKNIDSKLIHLSPDEQFKVDQLLLLCDIKNSEIKKEMPNLTKVEYAINTEFSNLINWAKVNRGTEYTQLIKDLSKQYANKSEGEKNDYIRYTSIVWAIGKYEEELQTENNALLKKHGFVDALDITDPKTGKRVQGEVIGGREYFACSKFFEFASQNNYPEYTKDQDLVSKYNTAITKLFKENGYTTAKQFEEDAKNYNKYSKETTDLDKKYSYQESLQYLSTHSEPENESSEKVQEYMQHLQNTLNYSTEFSGVAKKYGRKNIERYQKTMESIRNTQTKYPGFLNAMQRISQYASKIDSKKKELHITDDLLQRYTGYGKELESSGMTIKGQRVSKLKEKLEQEITGKSQNAFIFPHIKKALVEQTKQQAKTDEIRNATKMFPGIYHTASFLAGIWNGVVDATVTVGTGLGVLIMSAYKDERELQSQSDRAKKRNSFLKVGLSTQQQEPPVKDGKWNLKFDNGTVQLGSSISNMIILFSGAGVLAKGAGTGAMKMGVHLSQSLATKGGLFAWATMQGLPSSFQEALAQGLDKNTAWNYALTQTMMNSSLEMIAPNAMFFGNPILTGVLKQLGKEQGAKMIAKAFAKNISKEMGEEVVQESLQLATERAINRFTNDKHSTEFEATLTMADFTTTTVLTALTTGIVSGKGSHDMAKMETNHTSIKQWIVADELRYNDYKVKLSKVIDGSVDIGMTSDQAKVLLGELEVIEKVMKEKNNGLSDEENRKLLRNKIKEATSTPNNTSSLYIPKGKFAAPNEKFAETDEAFLKIVSDRKQDIIQLHQLNIEEFIEKSFRLILDEMGIDDPTLKLEITDDNCQYYLLNNTVSISKNWAGHTKKNVIGQGDKSEIFGAICHELNHYLQWKEIFLNFDEGNPNWDNLAKILQDSENGQKYIEYIMNKYPDNLELEAYFKKADKYATNFMNTYVSPSILDNGQVANYNEYKNQPVYEDFKIGEEIIKCRRLKNMLEEYNQAFATADFYRKTAIVSARQATEREKVSTSQDGMENYADPGDRIIQNPGDKDPYVFGNKKDPIEKRQEQFAKKYEAISDQPGKFRAKGIIKAVQVKENIVFDTSWGETMGTKIGGWVADGGYSIAEDSFKNTYEKFNPGVSPSILDNGQVANYNEYKNQPVEEESFRRGDIVVKAYKDIVTTSSDKSISLDRTVVGKNSQLSELDRITEAEKLLGQPLSSEQKKAILDAHNQPGEIYNLNFSQIRLRVDILKKAGLTSEQVRVLLENGICGNMPEDTKFIRKERMVAENFTLPLEINLASNKTLHIIRGVNTEYLIVDPTNPTREYKRLRIGEIVSIGRNTPHRFTLNNYVSGNHLQIFCEKSGKLIIEDTSTNGTYIKYRKKSDPQNIGENINNQPVYYDRKNLNNVLDNYSPKNLIQFFKIKYAGDYESDAGVWQKYTIQQHTEMVMNQFEKYFKNVTLPGNTNKNLFRIFLALHDIGKPDAIRNGGKELQYQFSKNKVEKILQELNLSPREIKLCSALVSQDIIGRIMKDKITSELAVKEIKAIADQLAMNPNDLLDLLIIYYKVDAGSYTKDAGGVEALDNLFVFDQRTGKIEISSYNNNANKIQYIKNAISKNDINISNQQQGKNNFSEKEYNRPNIYEKMSGYDKETLKKIENKESVLGRLPELKWTHRTTYETLKNILKSGAIGANAPRGVNFRGGLGAGYGDVSIIMKKEVEKKLPSYEVPGIKVPGQRNITYFRGNDARAAGMSIQEYTKKYLDFSQERTKRGDDPSVNVPYLMVGSNPGDAQGFTHSVEINLIEAVMIPRHNMSDPGYSSLKKYLEGRGIRVIEPETPPSILKYLGGSLLNFNAFPSDYRRKILVELNNLYPRLLQKQGGTELAIKEYLKSSNIISPSNNESFDDLKKHYNTLASNKGLSRYNYNPSGQWVNYMTTKYYDIEQQAYFKYLIESQYK